MDNQLLESARERAKSFFANARGSHGWDHVERVVNLCRRLGLREGCDMGILLAAAYLHDIGREECDREKGVRCHAETGAAMARRILEELGAPEAFIHAVETAVAAHRYRGGPAPSTPEAKVLFDADKLDGIGAVGIGRAFQFAGEIGARLHDPHVDVAATSAYGADDTAYREYLVKLRHVRARMLTVSGREIAEERNLFMEQFFNRLNKETEGEL
ncbi:MAG: HD domain-containing protein [Nitrospinae bacterium]|nr:HD domain-containing protein [Nitrospinota bacterium]